MKTRILGGLLFWLGAFVLSFLGLGLAGCGGGEPAHAGPVTVALLGDSTQRRTGDLLQKAMDAKFGAGAVVVTNYGVDGSHADDAPEVRADVKVANYGINDLARGDSPTTFRAHMLALHLTLVETPNPTTVYEDRDVAAFIAADMALGVPVADVYGYDLALPNWRARLLDGVHPEGGLNVEQVNNVLAPAVAAQVAEVLR